MESLAEQLSRELQRPLLCAEQYYSLHRAGAALRRHMDERHEELKGARGWTAPSRRSVSWLVPESGCAYRYNLAR